MEVLMKLSRIFSIAAVVFTPIFFIGCGPTIKDIPGGYVGVILTPTGWDGQIREAGQVDIGDLDQDGRGNTLILVESTTKNIKETFVMDAEGRDDRIYTQDLKMPLNADVYYNLAVSVDKNGHISSDAIKYVLGTITPTGTGDARVKIVTVDMIYSNLTKPLVRGKTRDLFSTYKDHKEVLAKQSQISKDIEGVVQNIFKENHVPMSVVNAQLSNVKQDPKIVAAQTMQITADADVQRINRIGAALKEYPDAKVLYLIDAIKAAPTGATVIINVGGNSDPDIWAAAKKYAK
jgi:regulator of protease activity HflC (stomatin/prohibitin superfamily)